MIIYTKELNYLNQMYVNRADTTLAIVEGNLGAGKSSFIKKFLEDKKAPLLSVKQRIDRTMLQPISAAINEFNLDTCGEDHVKNNVPLESYLKKQLLDIMHSVSEFIFYLDDITYRENNELLMFVADYIHFFINMKQKNKVFIIIEASSDKLTGSESDFLISMKKISPRKNHIFLNQTYRSELETYVSSLFYEPLDIRHTELRDILKAGFFNPLLIQRLVDYLRDRKVIDFDETREKWICRKIDVKITSNYFKDYIQSRYNALDNTLKDILKKAAYTGSEIDTKLLERPIGILEAEQKLSYIERLTKLICRETNGFQFENDEVYQVIEEYADKNEFNQWHNIIGEYLEVNLPKENTYVNFIQLYKIARHFQMGENYQKALYYYIKCISKSQSNLDYSCCISIGEHILELNKVMNINDFLVQYVWLSLAVSYQATADYSKACNFYKSLLDLSSTYYDKDYLLYNFGYSLYNAGDTKTSESILVKLSNNIIGDDKRELLIETLTILSGVYDQLGYHSQSQRFYSHAIDFSDKYQFKTKYYSLLRCCNMFLTAEMSIPRIEEAYNYFKQIESPFEKAFAAHNLGLEYLFCLNFERAEVFLEDSQQIFESYCSSNVCFPLNALGHFFAYKKDYKKALQFYEKALLYTFDDFITIVIKFNISQCHDKLNNIKAAEKELNYAEGLIKSGGDDLFVQYRNLCFIKAMRLIKEENLSKALEYLKKSYYYEVDKMNYHYYDTLIAKMVLSLSDILGIEKEDKFKEYEESILKGHIQILYEEHVLWANLEFWGV